MSARLFFFGLLAAVLVGGCFILDTRTIPAPEHPVEKVIGNERFFK